MRLMTAEAINKLFDDLKQRGVAVCATYKQEQTTYSNVVMVFGTDTTQAGVDEVRDTSTTTAWLSAQQDISPCAGDCIMTSDCAWAVETVFTERAGEEVAFYRLLLVAGT
ncbi:MAG: hypothetical protein OYH77_01985 [Pseudomonadota bacterium]|nr:hypothetical protein [Pseudomonadota bacterium]